MDISMLHQPSQLEANGSLLASVFSDKRRLGVRLMSGPERCFGVSTNLARVHLPFPPLSEDWSARTVTCGIALQCSPSKERVARLPLSELSKHQRQVLTLVEGAVAMRWALERWPGLTAEFKKRLPGLEKLDQDMDATAMLELALKQSCTLSEIPTYPLLGQLPANLTTRPDFIKALRRLYGRMPWSSKGRFSPGQFSIPAGGDGSVQNPNLPPPSRPEEDCPAITIGQRAGIPYPEWNVWTKCFLPNYVAVLERKLRPESSTSSLPDSNLRRWFEAHTHRAIEHRLEDGCDLNVDQYINNYVDRACGVATEDRVFRDMVPIARDVSTALLLDGSASLGVQQGRVFKLELACADALSRAMALARERHALFVFSGHTRHRVEVTCLKDFTQRHAVFPGQLGLNAGGYTRLGAPIRHLTNRLLEQPSERRVLIMIGDGQMSDEGYEGFYAWADVAHAVEEAEEAGIFLFYIGVGPARVDPLPDVFGSRRSMRINRVDELPRILAHVHQQLVAA